MRGLRKAAASWWRAFRHMGVGAQDSNGEVMTKFSFSKSPGDYKPER